jgi:hypothetical protein
MFQLRAQPSPARPFPVAIPICTCAAGSGRFLPTPGSHLSSPTAGSQRNVRGGWRLSRCSSSPGTCPAAGRPIPFAAASDWKDLLGLELTDPGFDASLVERIPRPSRGRRRGRASARRPPGVVPGTEAAGRPEPAAHRFHVRAWGRPLAQIVLNASPRRCGSP